MGMLSSALNLWMMEYFFTLELMRIGVIWTALPEESMTIRERIKRAFGLWLPYLMVFVLAVLSRLFIFNNQVYGISLTEQLKTTPLETLKHLVESILLSLRLVIAEVRSLEGEVLATWFLLTNVPSDVSAATIALWYYWRWTIEEFF